MSAKRRSSFVRGRKSLGDIEADRNRGQNQGMDNFVPEGLSEDEKQIRICLEECLLQLSREMPDLEEFDQFKVHVRTKVTEKLNKLKGEEKVKRLANPVNEDIDRQLMTLPGYIKKLKAEEEAWDELVRTRELLAESAQARADAVAETPIEFDPTLAISEVDRKLLAKKPDYSALHSEVVAEFESTGVIMEEIPKFVSAVEEAVKSVASRLKRETLTLHETLFPPSDFNPSEILSRRLQCDS